MKPTLRDEKPNKQIQTVVRKKLHKFLKETWGWSYENKEWLDSTGELTGGVLDLEQFILDISSQAQQEAVERERKKINSLIRKKLEYLEERSQELKQDMPAVLPKNQCTQCGAWVSDELKDDHICAAGEKKKTVFPEVIEGKDPDLIWRDGGMYVGVINRGDTIAMYTWDGIAESWITRNVFDRVDLFVKEF